METISTPNVSQKFIETLMLIHNNFYRQTKVPIPLNQFGVLMIVLTEEAVSITEISHILKISKQQMTTVIDKLVKNRLVQKQADINDRRRFVITLTPAGKQIIDDQNEIVRKRFTERIQHLTAAEKAKLGDAISNFNSLVEKMFAN
ncbi:MarR family transcriptional regulator [Selenomonas sp.]|uniref:MarR family winged helix-turn-helix transcriptional regulator n=1 Tax=Selenomonas sp. TaxID=2053611 RepID=UPI0025F4FCAA|nr:MarR family transcriptional regulator [Selenomonas sp.]MBQ1867058.1 winged helix DNA-binding protein [Selenomonas sp.]MCR5437882.1 MarR family transcriptional regulator [Selenomonas sp.]